MVLQHSLTFITFMFVCVSPACRWRREDNCQEWTFFLMWFKKTELRLSVLATMPLLTELSYRPSMAFLPSNLITVYGF